VTRNLSPALRDLNSATALVHVDISLPPLAFLLALTPETHNDCSHPLLLLWKGTRPASRPTRRVFTDARQVTGDLWERYMEMLTQDGMPEV
jgi:hypothetical protein